LPPSRLAIRDGIAVFPLLVDLTDRLGIVVGGGPVGRRKARSLLDAGAIVRLICLEPAPQDFNSPRLTWLREPYRPDHLTGAALVFAAATPELNRQIAADARSRGIWVNCANDPPAGDFIVPATLRRGGFVVSVGTGGAAPALARRVRDRLEPQFDQSFADWVALLREMRAETQSAIADEKRRQGMFDRWTEWPWLERVRREGVEAVRAAMRAELRRSAGSLIE
jgi:precorrin-2 dehydrogenase / sirohydrochlorin ferrochelatase